MRKVFVALLFSLLASSSFAARCMMYQIQDVQYRTPPNLTWSVRVIFAGTDVPGGTRVDEFSFETSSAPTPAQLASAAVAAVQARAIVLGFTVPAGSTLIPSYSAQ